MRKRLFVLFVLVSVFFSYLLLTKEVSIQQGINFKTHSVSMPLYMKVMDFLTRHNHYKLLVKDVIKGKITDKEKLIALFEWTSQNIRPVPEGFPTVDDHVDNIIIRGYGTDDQSADVFTTLLTVAGFKGGIYIAKTYPEKYSHAMSVVEFNKKLILFDTYYKFLFLNKNGDIASLSEVIKDIDLVRKVAGDFKIRNKYSYINFFKNLKPVDKLGWTKADLQIPLKRVMYIIGNFLNLTEPSNVFFGERTRA